MRRPGPIRTGLSEVLCAQRQPRKTNSLVGAGTRKSAVPKKLPNPNEPRAGGGDEGIRTLEAVSRLLP